MKFKIGDLVQFVECNKKRCKRPEAFYSLNIPQDIHAYTGKIDGFGKRFKFFTNKSEVLVCFDTRSKPHMPDWQYYWVPAFLLRPYEKLANHPITRIFV